MTEPNLSILNDNFTGVTLTNEQLIAKAISILENDDKTDALLLEVLSEYILKLNPKSSAVSDAVKAIETLAEERAKEQKSDSTDHD